MPTAYAAFRVDPSINFDNFNLGWDDDTPASPSVSNFSRPISYRPPPPVLSPHVSQPSFALSDSSNRSSYVSSGGPLTPRQDISMRESVAKPRIATPDNDQITSSWMLDTKGPKLDLSFSMESVMRTYQPAMSAPSSPVTPTAPVGFHRPLTSISLESVPKSRMCPVHGARKSMMSPRPPCPVHGSRLPSSALAGAPTFPDSRSSMGERPPAPPATGSAKSLPTLPFLSHDPFAQKSNDHDQNRPKSAGAGARQSGHGFDDFVSKKQSAPSIMSTRSTRSIRKGFSRVRRMLSRANLT